MRAVMVSFARNTESTGVGKWSYRLAAALRARGWTVETWFREDFPLLDRPSRAAEVVAVPLALCMKLARARQDFDVAIVHEPLGYWYGLYRRLGLRGPTLISMCHNVESSVFHTLNDAAARGFAQLNKGTAWKAPLFRLWQSDGAIKLADQVICLSSRDANYIAHQIGRKGRTTWVSNGVDQADALQRRAQSWGKRVLFVGGWLDIKGRRVLPTLWDHIVTAIPEARLTMVGTSASEAQVLADFSVRSLASVTVIPHIASKADMAAVYAEHDLFLMPSISEGSPLSLLEAMASGLPVAASRVGGIDDVVRNGVNGLLFNPLEPVLAARAIATLLESADMPSLSKSAIETARRLTWANVAAVVEDAAIASFAG